MNLRACLCALFICVSLIACGGGGGSSSGDQIAGGEETRILAGGRANAPTEIDPDYRHEITNDRSINYFSYKAKMGETIVIHSVLQDPLTDQQKSRCAASGLGQNDTDIYVYDEEIIGVGGVCGEVLAFKAPEDGVYIFQFVYSGNNGYALASIISDETLISPIGGSGAPHVPIALSFNDSNEIIPITFFNHFFYEADAGETIIIDALLSPPLTDTQKSQCAANSSSTSHRTSIHVYNSEYELVEAKCGESLRFVAPAFGIYLFLMDFYPGYSGHFNAMAI